MWVSQPATLCEQSVERLAIKTWTAWSKNCCCIEASGDTSILAFSCLSTAVTGRSMFKSPPPYQHSVSSVCFSCCFFPQTSFELFWVWHAFSLHCLRSAYFTTWKAGTRVGGGRVFRVCFGLFWLFFLILHSGFGYLKLCCRLPLVFLVAKWGKKRTWMSNKNTTNSVWFAWLLAWFRLKGGRELLDCNYQTLESFVFCFPQLPKCNFWEK